MNTKKIVFIIIVFFLVPGVSSAESYDFYVDKAFSGNENGSKENPFSDIVEAIDAAKSSGGSKSIFVENGEYSGDFSVGKSIRIIGESEAGVVVSGAVSMEDEAVLESLTVKDALKAVVVSSGAKVKIENCTIKNFKNIGIDVLQGNGSLTLRGSKIKDGAGKGIYAQAGNSIFIFNNMISGNAQEGIDIRNRVNGRVSDNLIERNEEGGIEIIIGGSDVVIENNVIRNNWASGISHQFYSTLDFAGKVYIFKNSIYGNGKYGVDCNIPHAGSPGKGYWTSNIILEGNNVYSNEIDPFRIRCKADQERGKLERNGNVVVDEFLKSEESEREDREISGQKTLSEEELKKVEEIKRREQEKEDERKKRLEGVKDIVKNQIEIALEVDKKIIEIEDSGLIKKFFSGYDKNELNDLSKKLDDIEKELERADELLKDVLLEEKDEAIETLIYIAREKNSVQRDNLIEKNNFVSVREWLGNIWK